MFNYSKKALMGAGLFAAFGFGNLGAQTQGCPTTLNIMSIDQSGAFAHTNAIAALGSYLQTLATQKAFTLYRTTSAADAQSRMTAASLNTYQVIIWNNNTSIGAIISSAAQRTAFQTWMKAGGGLVAWHGVMDHADLWPWMTDTVLGGTRFSVHSPWNSTAGRTALVRWDIVPTAGTVRANNVEYADLRAGQPAAPFVYPDEWYSFTLNPRPRVDVLLTIDETTFDVAQVMGDHPVAWAYHLTPTTPGGRQGRFIYHARGHETAAFTGTGANAAPNDVQGSANSPTSNFVWQSIRWAASCNAIVAIRPVRESRDQMMQARKDHGTLRVSVTGAKKYQIQVFDLSGRMVGNQSGAGDREFSFPGLTPSSVYTVQVHEGGMTYSERVVF